MDYHTLEDHALIQLIQREDAAALRELYHRYGKLVFSLALHIVGDSASAEEITQDVFLRVWQKSRQYDVRRAQVSTWITGIARNRSIDALRHRQIRPDFHAIAWDGVPPAMLQDETSPETQTMLDMRRQDIVTALRQLPEPQREVLFLAYFYGFTQQEISEHLKQPLGTVKSRIRLGMQKLRTLLVDEKPPA